MERKISWSWAGVLCLAAVTVSLGAYRYFQGRAPEKRRSGPPGSAVMSDDLRRRVPDLFHEMFYNSSDTWLKNCWMGIPTEQNPNDVWITQEIIVETKPDLIVETGTFCGGSALLWAMILDCINPKGRVITIDIGDGITQAHEYSLFQRKVDFLLGSSTSPAIVAEVTRRAKGRKVMVILDSDHKKSHVLEEMKAYGPLVPLGGYMIVQDTDVNGHPVYLSFGEGPYEAVEEFLSLNHSFEPDRGRERLLFTMHPKGYLKRIR